MGFLVSSWEGGVLEVRFGDMGFGAGGEDGCCCGRCEKSMDLDLLDLTNLILEYPLMFLTLFLVKFLNWGDLGGVEDSIWTAV